MRRFAKAAVSALAGAVLVACSTLAAQAQDYPDRPVTLIIPYSPGGGTDILGRILGQKLSELWGQPVVVENRPGASGLVGAKAAMQSTADGYTLVVGSTGTLMSVATNAGVKGGGEFDVEASLSPITLIAAPPYFVATHPSLGVNSVEELIALAKEDPSKTRFGSSGVGSASHLTGALFNDMAGVEMLHVPYKGTGQAVTDLLSGEITLMFGPAPTLRPHVEAGSLKVLAVTPAKRSGLFPDFPTVDEAGVAGFESAGWFGLFAPAGTPDDIIAQVNEVAVKALDSDDVREQLGKQGAEPAPMSVSDFTDFVRNDTMKWITLREAVTK